MFVFRFARWFELRSGLAAFAEVLSECVRFAKTIVRSRTALGAEVLFLRKSVLEVFIIGTSVRRSRVRA